MNIRKVRLEDAIGLALSHDLTKIVPKEYKGPIFKKGHIIQEADVAQLLSRGCKHVYVLELSPGEVHEDEAALRLAKACAGHNVELEGPSEGRVNLRAKVDGFVKVKVEVLEMINSIDDLVLSTVHNFTRCTKGMVLAGTRTISLVVDEDKIRNAEDICKRNGSVLDVALPRQYKIGVIITGDEVFEGRIEDRMLEAVQKKIEDLGSKVISKEYCPDNAFVIADAIGKLKDQGCEIILASAGMSKDADDVTPAGIKLAGARIESYGAPVLPGSMFLMAYLEDTPILGVPACVIHDKYTILDLILPRILVGERVNKTDIIRLAHGGLCLHCLKCTYPLCTFGKGV